MVLNNSKNITHDVSSYRSTYSTNGDVVNFLSALPINDLFAIDKLGVSTYFLSLCYLFLAIFASFKLKRINKYIVRWSTQKLFHLFIVVHLYVRSIAFAALSVTAITKTDVWYPIVVMLFTLPEVIMVSTYVILFFHWLEIYLFSHRQFMITSRKNFRTQWRYIFVVVTALLYGVLSTLYIMLMTKSPQFESLITEAIEFTTIVGNYALIVIFGIIAYYFESCLLSGYPFASAVAERNVKKIGTVTIIWTLGRLVRATDVLLRVTRQYFSFIGDTFRSMIFVGGLFIAEFISIIVALDWTFVGILLILEEREDIPNGIQSHNRRLLEPSISATSFLGTTYMSKEMRKWKISIEDIQFNSNIYNNNGISFLQKGSYNDATVCIKGFTFEGVSLSTITSLTNDLINFSTISHKYVVEFLGAIQHRQTVYSVSEYMPNGSLFDLIQNGKKGFNSYTIIRAAKQIANAMQYLHTVNHIHGHLKSRNILMDSYMNCKVSDIGIRQLKAYAELVSTKRIATAWSSPEVIQGDVATEASDVYSYGIICWEMVTGKIPYHGQNISSIYRQVVINQTTITVPQLSDVDVPESFLDIIENSLNFNANRRSTFSQISFCLTECSKELDNYDEKDR